MTRGMIFKGTQGPWVKHPVKAQIDSSSMSANGGLLPIAQCLWPTDERSEEETLANEHLIAAAPDLLDAAQSAYDALIAEGMYEHATKLEAAIAKALGEQK